LPTSTPKQPEQCRMSQSIAQQKSADCAGCKPGRKPGLQPAGVMECGLNGPTKAENAFIYNFIYLSAASQRATFGLFSVD